MKSRSLIAIILLISPLTSLSEDRGQFQSHASIINAVKNYITLKHSDNPGIIQINVSSLDHRIKLKQCDRELEAFSPPGSSVSGKSTIGVRCKSPNPWTIYVSAYIESHAPVVVAARNLNKGNIVHWNDVKTTRLDTNTLLRGYFSKIDNIIGKKLKRNLLTDEVITPSRIQMENLVKRGQEVTILSGSGSINIQMKGKALKSGNPGDLIPIQNLTSKRKIEAKVISSEHVRVN